ncbi:MAG: hypothetical protein EZS28_020438 [Streblomastix strix]|uniref:Uncharacterized protein n=1 Tax=Streblomastix strix TaxID=222440 RepID=A0A5J4VNV7_9EUKA|nr:MAG: hypothetical protein EZS28_020438 [Streblomastix strix]
MSYMLVAYNVGCLPVMFIATLLSTKMNFKLVIRIPMLAQGIAMLAAPLSCILFPNKGVTVWIMVIISFIIGICTGILNSSIFSIASIFSSREIIAIMLGQGISGLISIIPLLLFISIPGDNTDSVGMIFFSFASLVLFISIAGDIWMYHLPYSKKILMQHQTILRLADSEQEDNVFSGATSSTSDMQYDRLLTPKRKYSLKKSSSENAFTDERLQIHLLFHIKNTSASFIQSHSEQQQQLHAVHSSTSLLPQHSKPNKKQSKIQTYIKLLHKEFNKFIPVAKRQIWWGVAVLVSYAITLLIFPNVILAIPPIGIFQKDEYHKSLWTLIKLNVFTVGDFIARWLPNYIRLYKSCLICNIISLIRFLFALILLLCCFVKAFQNMWVIFITYSIFSLTNGYHGTIVMSRAGEEIAPYPAERGVSERVASAKRKEKKLPNDAQQRIDMLNKLLEQVTPQILDSQRSQPSQEKKSI